MIYIVLDTETSGIKKRPLSELTRPTAFGCIGDSVVQLGALVYNCNFELQKTVCLYNNILQADLSAGARQVNGLSMQVLRPKIYSVTLEQNLSQYLPEIFGRDVCLVGYNVLFDFTLISQTIRNFAQFLPFEQHKKLAAPKHGRSLVDVADYFAISSGSKKIYKRLTQVSTAYSKQIREEFDGVSRYVMTNLPEEFAATGNAAHSALFDAVATSVLWREKVCPTWI